jgi:hypothetical protein
MEEMVSSLLDGVEPDGFLLKTGHGTRLEVEKPEAMIDFWKPLYSSETVERLMAEHRKAGAAGCSEEGEAE